MAIQLLFDDTCEFNLGGIKSLYMTTELIKSTPFYPLNYFVSGNTVVDIEENIVFTKVEVGEDAVVSQVRESDGQGKWYSKELNFTIPKIDLQTSRFFNSILFKQNIVSANGVVRPVNIKNYNTTIIFEDMNDNWWIAGYDVPFKITNYEMQTGNEGGENKYELSFRSRSYDRIRKIIPELSCGTIVFTATTTTSTSTTTTTTSTSTTSTTSTTTTTTSTSTTSTTTTSTTTTSTTTTVAPVDYWAVNPCSGFGPVQYTTIAPDLGGPPYQKYTDPNGGSPIFYVWNGNPAVPYVPPATPGGYNPSIQINVGVHGCS